MVNVDALGPGEAHGGGLKQISAAFQTQNGPLRVHSSHESHESAEKASTPLLLVPRVHHLDGGQGSESSKDLDDVRLSEMSGQVGEEEIRRVWIILVVCPARDEWRLEFGSDTIDGGRVGAVFLLKLFPHELSLLPVSLHLLKLILERLQVGLWLGRFPRRLWRTRGGGGGVRGRREELLSLPGLLLLVWPLTISLRLLHDLSSFGRSLRASLGVIEGGRGIPRRGRLVQGLRLVE